MEQYNSMIPYPNSFGQQPLLLPSIPEQREPNNGEALHHPQHYQQHYRHEVVITGDSAAAAASTTTTTTTTTEDDHGRSLVLYHRNRRHHHQQQQPQPPSHRSSRSWQLPQDSIHEYVQWILSKPPESQTPLESRFLYKYHRRMLLSPPRTISHTTVNTNNYNKKLLWMDPKHDTTWKQYISKLQEKDHLTEHERLILHQFHRMQRNRHRRHGGRRRRQAQEIGANEHESTTTPILYWKRVPNNNNNNNNNHASTTQQNSGMSTTLMQTMANLQESMNRMGLSSNLLLCDGTMEDADDDNDKME